MSGAIKYQAVTLDQAGKPIPLVAVFASTENGDPDGSGYGATTNENGIASFQGNARFITARSTGYLPQTVPVKARRLAFTLSPRLIKLKTVNIIAEARRTATGSSGLTSRQKWLIGGGVALAVIGVIALSHASKEDEQ